MKNGSWCLSAGFLNRFEIIITIIFYEEEINEFGSVASKGYTSPHFPRIFILPLLLIWLLVDINSYSLPLKSASVSLNKYLVYGPRDTSTYVQYTS